MRTHQVDDLIRILFNVNLGNTKGRMKGAIVAVGDEILLGQIINTNAAWLGDEMAKLGIDVIRSVTIQDNEEDIRNLIVELSDVVDIICMTGGLGPTKDDITKKTIADLVDSPMYLDEVLLGRIKGYFDKRNIPFLEAHYQQCYMPEKAIILENNMGTAPGMLFKINNTSLLSMPGVPYEMKWIFKNSFKSYFVDNYTTDAIIYHHTIRTVGVGESWIAQQIDDIVKEFPDHMSMAYLPNIGQVRLRITSKDTIDRSHEVLSFAERIKTRLGLLIFAEGTVTLSETLQSLCIEKGVTLSTAESCTGGFLSHQITSNPGCSKYYMGSTIVYSNASKKTILNVNTDTIDNYGAVSEATVKEMLLGSLDLMNTDMAISISGIAGPGGGSLEKPVGTVWLAWGNREDQRTKQLTLAKDRIKNIEYTTVFALNALRKFVLENY